MVLEAIGSVVARGAASTGSLQRPRLRMNASLFQWDWNNEAFIHGHGVGPRVCGCLRCRWTSPARTSSSRSGRRRPHLPLRPHLADVVLDVHLRQRLSRHLSQPAGRRVLHARRALLRQGRREAHAALRQGADARGLAAPRHQEARRQGRGRRAQDPGRRRGLRVPQPARLRRRPGLRPSPVRAPHRTPPAGDQAGRLLAAADPTDLRQRGADGRHRRSQSSRSASTTGAAGAPAGTTWTGTARATPRRTSAGSPSTSATVRSSWS